MAMLPFCGYNMGDYFAHWLAVGEKGGADAEGNWGTMPRIFYVNWFRKDDDGRFLWPGFGENSRVLKWVFERCDDAADYRETAIGLLPTKDALDLDGLDVADADLEQLLSGDPNDWLAEIQLLHDHFSKFGDRLPQGLRDELEALEARLMKARK
jgi:phosphoenolpyruvate carboxykinase (GTP)